MHHDLLFSRLSQRNHRLGRACHPAYVPHARRIRLSQTPSRLRNHGTTMGAAYLLLVDNIARTLSSAEIPLGMLTALIGAPFFAYLLIKGKAGWQI